MSPGTAECLGVILRLKAQILIPGSQYWSPRGVDLPQLAPLNIAEKTPVDAAAWSEIAIVSSVALVLDTAEPPARVTPACGEKCARCWRVLPEVGSSAAHPSLCLRCTDAVESGLVGKPAV
ncbi:MAG: zinc finger domain-containing protein [Rhodopila sp.]|jgi:hypothetical protein